MYVAVCSNSAVSDNIINIVVAVPLIYPLGVQQVNVLNADRNVLMYFHVNIWLQACPMLLEMKYTTSFELTQCGVCHPP